MDNIIEKIRKDLIKFSDPEHKKSSERYFKEDIKLYGIKASDLHAIEREHFRALDDKGKENVFRYCDLLFKSAVMEESLLACMWADRVHRQFKPEDFTVFDSWVRKYIDNWATCDTLCNHPVGNLIMSYPDLISDVKKWTKSSNRWVKRASAVTFIIPARKGMFREDITEIASVLLTDEVDMVQKGYGWMLKACSEAHLQYIFEFVMKNKHQMPRTSLRYAIEKMPADLKAEAMKK